MSRGEDGERKKVQLGREGFAGQLSEGPAEDGCARAPRREGGDRKQDLGLGVVTRNEFALVSKAAGRNVQPRKHRVLGTAGQS